MVHFSDFTIVPVACSQLVFIAPYSVRYRDPSKGTNGSHFSEFLSPDFAEFWGAGAPALGRELDRTRLELEGGL